jgi:hypothetical protein
MAASRSPSSRPALERDVTLIDIDIDTDASGLPMVMRRERGLLLDLLTGDAACSWIF